MTVTRTAHSPDLTTAAGIVTAWEAQQDAYVNRREDRFTTMLHVLADVFPGGPRRVLDLAGGCGSIAARVRRMFPDAEVTVADKDPVLLELARRTIGRDPRVSVVEIDLTDSEWTARLDGPFDAVLSATALHWLPPHGLACVYADLADVTTSDAVVMNADHLRYCDRTQPTLTAVAAIDDQRTQDSHRSAGALDWDEWWTHAEALDGMAPHAERRAQVWAGVSPHALATLSFHLEALRAAGWAEAGVVWRYLDDVIVFGRR